MANKTAVILIGHGSQLKGFDRPMRRVAADLRKDHRHSLVLCAFLELNPPSIEKAIDACFEKKIKEVFLLPYFLLKGRHTQEDIPRIAEAARKKYPGKMKINLCPCLGYHEKITAVVLRRLKEKIL